MLGRMPAGRGFTPLEGDMMLVSYPRSGNTWLRFLLGNLVSGQTTFTDLESKIADIYTHTDRDLVRIPRPRMLKSHEYFDPRYRRTVMLVRDPRDIALSYYRWHMRIGKFPQTFPLERFVDGFLAGGWDPYGPWGDNVGSWLGAREGDETFLLVRYETLVSDPVAELARIARFLGIRAGTDSLQGAVDLSSVTRMRHLERTQSGESEVLRQAKPDVPFVGPAVAGRWRTDLPAQSANAIVQTWSKRMASLGYTDNCHP
jgi:hypothetical protein